MPKDQENWKGRAQQFRVTTWAFAIPIAMVLYPVVGFYLFNYIGLLFEMESLKYFGLIMGIFAGFRECYRLIRKLNNETNRS